MRLKNICLTSAVILLAAFGPAAASQAKEKTGPARSDKAQIKVTTKQLKKVGDLNESALKSLEEKLKKHGMKGLEAMVADLSAAEIEVLQTPITETTESVLIPVAADSSSQPVLTGGSGSWYGSPPNCWSWTLDKSTQNWFGATLAYSAEVMTYYCPVSNGQMTQAVGKYRTQNAHWGYNACGWNSDFDYNDGFGHRYGGVGQFALGPDCWLPVIQHSVEWAAGHNGSVFWWTN